MEDRNIAEDEVIEVPVGKAKKVMNFVKKNRTPIAAVVVGGAAFGLGIKVGSIEVSKLETTLGRLRGEFEENLIENGAMMEFIDYKKLRDAYFKYANEHDLLV